MRLQIEERDPFLKGKHCETLEQQNAINLHKFSTTAANK